MAFHIRSAVMPTAKECRHHAAECLKLAGETQEIYAKMALIELANEFRAMAGHLEREARQLTDVRRRAASPRRVRR
jgi:hypothetical protein